MSTMRRKSFVRCASFVFAAAVAVTCASAQSASEPASTAESSSSLVADLAYPSAPTPMGAADPAPNSARSNRYATRNGWKQKIASNYALEFGGGFNAPTSDSAPYISWGGNFTVGAGYNFTPRLALMAEYQFIDAKLPGHIIADAGADGGNAHIWSFTLNPVVSLFPKAKNDVYITGGGGFYRKMTNFTLPEDGIYCDYYYGCYNYTSNVVAGHFSSNQGGVNIGMGYQRRLAGAYRDSRMKLFAEARYLHVFTPAMTVQPAEYLYPVSVGEGTTIIPVTFGVRW
jgi:hypothetical protein